MKRWLLKAVWFEETMCEKTSEGHLVWIPTLDPPPPEAVDGERGSQHQRKYNVFVEWRDTPIKTLEHSLKFPAARKLAVTADTR
jgi:hypothetical protein